MPKRITNQQHVQIAHPYQLVRAALLLHSLRHPRLRLQPPHFIACEQQTEGQRLAHVKFWPQQLRRFLRGCVATTALRLAAPLGNQRVDTRTMSVWKNRIFLRVMGGFVKRVEVRRQEARFAP